MLLQKRLSPQCTSQVPLLDAQPTSLTGYDLQVETSPRMFRSSLIVAKDFLLRPLVFS